MYRYSLFLVCMLAGTSATAQQWFGETGQGWRSSSIEYGRAVLGVDCATPSISSFANSSIRLSFNGRNASGNVIFQFDDGSTLSATFKDGSFEARNNATARTFNQITRSFASKNTVVATTSKDKHSFSLRGSSGAIGQCNANPK